MSWRYVSLQRRDLGDLLTDRVRTHLLVVAYHDYFLGHPKCDQTSEVTLTRFVDNDDIEGGLRRIEAIHDPGHRHDPYRHRAPTLIHQLARFREKARRLHTCSGADSPHGVDPTLQCRALVLPVGDSGELMLPR